MIDTIRELLQKEPWQPVSKGSFTAYIVGLAIFILIILKCERGFIYGLDGANLLFHEAGHPFFGLVSSRLAVYGGTLGQLIFPLVVTIGFWKQGHTVSFAIGWIWFFENFFNIARYMADAQAQILPLVGGGEHDWLEIFGRWHMLRHDVDIANIVRISGWVGIVLVSSWLIWRAGRREAHQESSRRGQEIM